MLGQGRADLALLRQGTARDEVARDRVRRALALRAARYDRRDTDLPLLRHLLAHEAEASTTDELRLAAVLVGLHGLAEDLPLLHTVRETTYDTWCGPGGIPEPGASGEELREWARRLDLSFFGTDPGDEPESTWTGLAREQGLDEVARVALIRRLDQVGRRACAQRPVGSDAPEPHGLAHEFMDLGDTFQALRAQRLFTALQDTARVPDDSLKHWRGTDLGAFVVDEHHEVARAAAADPGLAEEVREVTEAAAVLLPELSEAVRRGVRR
ncbi:hypothetical protein [Streptomyces sp. NPDC127066]|uniref:hypothetical protein n=1 Tax=Streptomyces sp. NPDC127066 TaxID=3347125 RepID=UPI00364CCB46